MPPVSETQNQNTSPQPSQVQTKEPAIMQSNVQYTAGKFVTAPSGYGLLEWSADGRIKLFDMDAQTKQAKGVLFDVTPSEITKIVTSMSVLNLSMEGKFFALDFSRSAVPWMMAGGAVGLAMAHKKTKESGIKWWVENLRGQGVKVTDFNFSGKAGKIMIVGVVALIIVITIIMMGAGY